METVLNPIGTHGCCQMEPLDDQGDHLCSDAPSAHEKIPSKGGDASAGEIVRQINRVFQAYGYPFVRLDSDIEYAISDLLCDVQSDEVPYSGEFREIVGLSETKPNCIE